MEITKVTIKSIGKEKLLASVSVTFDDEFVVHGLKIMLGEKGEFVAFPSEKWKDGEWHNTAYPVTADFREYMIEEIMSEWNKTGSKKPSKPSRSRK